MKEYTKLISRDGTPHYHQLAMSSGDKILFLALGVALFVLILFLLG